MPSVEYFVHWSHHGMAWLEAQEHYQKRTWRNRTAILSPGSSLLLTVPLKKGKHQQQPIREVRIAFEEPWTKTHLQSFQSAYGKTAFGGEIIPGIESILHDCPERLFDLNLALLTYIMSLMRIDLPYALTTAYHSLPENDIMDFRSGVPAGIPFDAQARIPTYPQVQRLDRPFQANLSILDALCHLGPDTAGYIRQYALIRYP